MLDKLTGSMPSALTSGLKGLMGGASGKNEKATIFIQKEGGMQTVSVQFNPSEYTITRGVQLSKEKGVGTEQNAGSQQTVNASTSTLQVSLYFDSLSDVKGLSLSTLVSGVKGAAGTFSAGTGAIGAIQGATAAIQADTRVNAVSKKFLSLIKFDSTQHQPPAVVFVWGSYLAFGGTVQNSTVQYTMFMADGTPVRAKITLSIVGEELDMSQEAQQKPNESPDRTKDRLLLRGDQIWMIANDEYGDPGQWKVIAEANGILNPRKIDRAVRLKVPSIR